MSRKSRPDKPAKGGKGKKGKKNAVASSRVVEEIVEPSGPPFGMIVLIAVVLSIPSLMRFMDGDMEFRATMVRFLGGLAVSWVLCQLVYSVIASFKTETTTQVEHQTHQENPYPPAGPYRPPPMPDPAPGDPDGTPRP